MKENIHITDHAKLRMFQRGIRLNELIFCLEVGEPIHRTGAVFYVLTDRNLSKMQPFNSTLDMKKLRGLTAIIEMDRGIPYVTKVYKNRKAIRSIREKAKIDIRKLKDYL